MSLSLAGVCTCTMASTSGGTAAGRSAGTYASAAGRNVRQPPIPSIKKEQGIIMQMINDIEPEEYVYAMANITDPQNIINYSKISYGRIRIYFKNKQIVEEITTKNKTIKINDIDIPIRPLLIPSKRIIISNACPEIPHEIIEKALNQLGLKTVSSMFFLRAGLRKPGFEHILSARRCVYVAHDFESLPETTTVQYEESEHRIFITDDSEFCTHCKKHGHLVEICKYKQTDTQTKNNNNEKKEENEPTPNNKEKRQENIQSQPEIVMSQQTTQLETQQSHTESSHTKQVELPETQQTIVEKTEENITEKTVYGSQKRTRSQESIEENPDNVEEILDQENSQDQSSKSKKLAKTRRTRSWTYPGCPAEEWLQPLKHVF